MYKNIVCAICVFIMILIVALQLNILPWAVALGNCKNGKMQLSFLFKKKSSIVFTYFVI